MMTYNNDVASLPYNLPNTEQEQLEYLADIVKIPKGLIKNGSQSDINAICATILYRHLDRNQKMDAMAIIKGLKNQSLGTKLVDKVLHTNYINPQWGIWSLTNEELLEDQALHSIIDTYASVIGLGMSALSTKDLVKKLWNQRKFTRGGLVTIVLWGTLIFNKAELHKANKEVLNRSKLKSSKYY